MKISDQGLAFVAAHEGFVARGYLDPAGIVTIGYGFTMASRLFAAWWRQKHGRSLKVGDRLSREDANRLLLTLLDEEYAPPVLRALPGLTQPQFDACVSAVYNLGARALSWRWAKALKAGRPGEAARLLARTGTSAAGRRLNGLVRRRTAEAYLLETGAYDLSPGAGAPEPNLVRALQASLKRLGFDPGLVDGVFGPATRAAVEAFQRANPPLTVDGIFGPATRATLERVEAARDSPVVSVLLSVLTTLGAFGKLPWPVTIALAGAAFGLCLAALWLWRHRGAAGIWFRSALLDA